MCIFKSLIVKQLGALVYQAKRILRLLCTNAQELLMATYFDLFKSITKY